MRKSLHLFLGLFVAMLFVAIQPASAYDNYKEFFFKATATAQPTGAGKVYVSNSTSEPSADLYAETSADEGMSDVGYDNGDPEPESATGERELWAKPNPGYTFAGWATAENPSEILSTDKHYTAEFTVTGADKKNRQAINFVANFKETGIIENGQYYIRNIESGKFISQGQWWGTHATLDGDGLAFDVTYDEANKTYTLQNALGYFGNDEYIDAPEARIGKWAITLKDGIFTMAEGGRNLCVDGVNVYLNADNAAANWEFVPATDRQTANGTFAKPADMTYMIKHPNFEANKGAWVVEGATNMGDLDKSRGGDFTAESWNSASFSVKQTIEGLKPGIYRLTFNGYYRYNVAGGDNNNEKAIAAHADGSEVINAYVQLNATEQPLLSVADEASVELAGGVTPNNIGEAQAAFAKGAYINEIIASVGEDGKLEIAIKKDQQAATDWTIFDNMQLEYLGAFPAINSDDTHAYVSEVSAGEVTAVFNIEGTGIEIADESLIQVKLGVYDEYWGSYEFDTDVEGAILTSEIEELGDGTTNLYVTFASETITYGEQYRIKIQNGALSCYGLTNNEATYSTIITPNKPAELLSELEIVGEVAGTLNFIEGGSYENAVATIENTKIASLLDCAEGAINADVVVSPLIVKNGENYAAGDTLQSLSTQPIDGWFGRYYNYDEDSGKDIVITPNALHSWGSGCTTFIHAPKLENGTFTVTYGQFPGTLQPGDTDNIVLYVLNGNKAVKVTFVTNVEEKPVIGFDSMTQIACDTININNSYDANNYDGPSFTVDTKAVAAALNCSEEALVATFFASEVSLSSEHTANNGGCWLDENGYVVAYGQATFFLEPDENGKYAGWHTGHMPNKFNDIEEDQLLQSEFIFMYGDNYYKIHVNYNVKAPKHDDEPVIYTEKAAETINKQIIPTTVGYNGADKLALDMDYIKSVIGTTDFTLYSDVWDAETESFKWSKNYTCTPAPGFWFGSTEHNGYVTNDGWGTGSAFGFTYAAGQITWYEIPDGTAHEVGSSYSAKVYLVNGETGAYITYTITVSYVDEIAPETEIVGQEKLTMPMDDTTIDSEGLYTLSINTANALATLDITTDELEAATPVVAKSKSTFAEGSYETTFYLNESGAYTDDDESASFTGTLSLEGDVVKISIDDMGYFLDHKDTSVNVTIGIKNDGKIYLYNITMTNDPEAVGINAAAASAAPAVIYNIAGQKLSAPVKGINIINGVKVIK